MSKEKLVPKLRFNNFSSKWDKKTLGELGNVAMNKRIFKNQTSDKGEVPFYKIGTFGKKPDAYVSRKLFDEYKSKYSYPKIGDILISASGSIGRTVEYQGEDAYFQDSNIVWLSHNGKIDNSFLKQFYKIVSWHGLEGSTIKRLYNSNILNTWITLPSVAEQQKIGIFFEKIDQMIQLQQSKVNKVKDIKSAYLSEMFPKEGEKYPKKRFKGFQRGWDTSNIGQITRINKGKQLNKENMVENGRYYVLNGGITPSGYTNTYNTEGETISISEGGNSCGYVNYNKEKFWSGGHNYALTNLKTNVSFLYYFLKSRQYSIMSLRVGSGLPNIQITALSEFDVLYPLKDEQKKIGQFFKNLDKQISVEEEKLDKLEKLKQAYLNDMFV